MRRRGGGFTGRAGRSESFLTGRAGRSGRDEARAPSSADKAVLQGPSTLEVNAHSRLDPLGKNCNVVRRTSMNWPNWRAALFLHFEWHGARHRSPLTIITEAIIGAAIDVHRALGPGLLESAYQACLEYELAQWRVAFRRQVPVPVIYKGVRIDCGYRLDPLVDDRVIVEVKAVEWLAPIHEAQMITHLKLTHRAIGLLLNFNQTSLRKGIRRIENRFLNVTAVR